MEVLQQETVFLPEMSNKQQPFQESPFGASFFVLDSFRSTVNFDDNPFSPAVSPCNCNCSSAKRRFPDPAVERFPKKPNHNSDSRGNFLDLSLSPIGNSTTQSFPSFGRCVSDPYTPPRSPSGGFSVISLAPIPTQSLFSVPDPYTPPRSPNSHKFDSLAPQLNRISVPNASPLPPKPPAFPIPSTEKTLFRSSSFNKIITEESPNLERWQRMKDRLKEMNEWLDKMREGEELKVTVTENPVKVSSFSQEDDVLLPNGGEEEEEEGGGVEEAVWVEKTKECLTLHFKCPCGKGYQILLADGKCYYKLI